jgi:hypothetical protein
MPVTPAVSYLLLGLQDVQWAVGNSRGARKLARTPHVNKKKEKKRKKEKIIIQDDSILELALGIQCTVPKRSHWNSHHTTSDIIHNHNINFFILVIFLLLTWMSVSVYAHFN